MSVECRLYIGLTLEIKKDLTTADFKKYHEFIEKHPGLDEYYSTNKEGKLLLISDGDGDFLRLIKVDTFIDGGSLGSANEFIELPTTIDCFADELIGKMIDIYVEYTGAQPALDDFKYAIWSRWH